MKPDLLLAGFDLDGTILEHDSSWAAIHRHFGTEHRGVASLKLYTEGDIDYREFMRRDISSWPRGVTRSEIEEVLSGYVIRKEAPKVLAELKARGMKTALVTSGIDMLAGKVAAELGMDYWVANSLRFDREGVVMPDGIGRVDPKRKDQAYRRLLKKAGMTPKNTIAVGDTIYDLAFLKSAAMGFMLAHHTRVPDRSIIHIEKLTEILDYL